MPLSHQSEVFSVDDGAWYSLTTDPAGGTATYGAKKAIAGIRTISFSPDLNVKELFGDNAVIGRAAKPRQIMCTIGFAKMDLDLIAQALGGAVADTGTTPSQISTYTVSKTDAGKYFRIIARSLGTAPEWGDVTYTLHKCKVTAFDPVPENMEDYAIATMTVAAVARNSDSQFGTIVAHETATALPS